MEIVAGKEKHAQAITELEESRRRLDEVVAAGEKEVTALKQVQEGVIRAHEKRYNHLLYSAKKEIKRQQELYEKLSQTAGYLQSNNATLEKKSQQQAIQIGRLQDETETQRSNNATLENTSKQQALQIGQLQDETEIQRSHITELIEAILQSSTIATPSRDDDYFAGEFARLTGALRQWVLRYFDPQSAPVLRYRDLSAILAHSLAKTTLSYSSTISSFTRIKLGRKEIEAGIANRLTEHIFDPSFVFAMSAWPSVSPTEYPTVSGMLHNPRQN